MSNEDTEALRLVSVMNGGACAGFLIDLGPHGVEAPGQAARLRARSFATHSGAPCCATHEAPHRPQSDVPSTY